MKRGISLIVISVSAIVVLTLLGVITFSLIETSNKAKKIQFAEEIEMVQIAVKSYYNINKLKIRLLLLIVHLLIIVILFLSSYLLSVISLALEVYSK